VQKLDAHKGESGHEVDELERERDWLNAQQLDAAREAGRGSFSFPTRDRCVKRDSRPRCAIATEA
jgi:hypothetical protein